LEFMLATAQAKGMEPVLTISQLMN
jgi:hypothetical protein